MELVVAYIVEDFVPCEDKEIGDDRNVLVYVQAVYPQFHENVLQDVLCLMTVVEQTKRIGAETGIVFSEQLFETCLVAVLESYNKDAVGFVVYVHL